MDNGQLIPHLFRIEYRKIVAVLYKRFGFDQIEIAEDIASETFLIAAQSWGLNGVPQHPTAWLYNVARNKAKNYLQRGNVIAPALKHNSSELSEQEIDLSPQNINDSQLQMMFALCHPSISHEAQIGLSLRKELCFEAMRLCTMLVENKYTNKPPVNALLALMCFHASRFEARLNKNGELILYEEQDTDLWNSDLISKGGYFLHCAASENKISKYHLEAGIAYWHTQKSDTKEKWENILQLYNQLLQIEYSPIAAQNFQKALSLAKTQTDQHAIQKKIDKL